MFLENWERRVIPRWRDYRTTVALGELGTASPSTATIPRAEQQVLENRYKEWKEYPTVWHAADLLSSAYVIDAASQFKEVAEFILANESEAPKPLVAIASEVVSGKRELDEMPALEELEAGAMYRRIHSLRKLLSDEPRNPIPWVELSRCYKLLGHDERARRSMVIASQMGPDSRFVVRSAARLFLNQHDPPLALRTIRKASGVKSDPWLLSAEVAVASAGHYPSLFAKIARRRLDDSSLSDFDKTELASAIGTLELENGKQRLARQYFRQSLTRPNDNSLAQAEWANRQVGGIEIAPQALAVPRSFEALAYTHFNSGRWSSAVEEGVNWLKDQQFSRWPAAFTSYVSSLIGDHDHAITLLNLSLRSNPDDPLLLNNLAFSLASQGRVEDAQKALQRVPPQSISGVSAVTLAATQGLVLFRAGFTSEGRELYLKAMEKATSLGFTKYRAMAALYLAREEMLARTNEWQGRLKQALEETQKYNQPDVSYLADRIEGLAGQMLADSSAGG